MTPRCPECGGTLTARPLKRRVIEGDGYVECHNGHIFELFDRTDHPIFTLKDSDEGGMHAVPEQLAEESGRGLGMARSSAHRAAER